MRRKALKLANLRKCVTNSSQTKLSHFRRENETQVYLPKENVAQTKRDGETNVPNHQAGFEIRSKIMGLSFKPAKPTT